MATTHVEIGRTVVSTTAAVNGEGLRVGGFPTTVQVKSPAASSLATIQVSHDGVNWVSAHYKAGTTTTALGSGQYLIDEKPVWVRPVADADTAAPHTVEFIFSAYKES